MTDVRTYPLKLVLAMFRDSRNTTPVHAVLSATLLDLTVLVCVTVLFALQRLSSILVRRYRDVTIMGMLLRSMLVTMLASLGLLSGIPLMLHVCNKIVLGCGASTVLNCVVETLGVTLTIVILR